MTIGKNAPKKTSDPAFLKFCPLVVYLSYQDRNFGVPKFPFLRPNAPPQLFGVARLFSR